MICRWCGSSRRFGDPCGACPCPLDMNEAILSKLDRLTTTRAPRERRPTAAGILSARTAARRLGIGRDTLARLVEAGKLATVPKGTRRGFRAVDVEKLVEVGYMIGPDATAKPAPKRTRRRSVKTDASIAAKLAEF